MPYLITAHSTKPGKEALYEQFLEQRKLWFVRNLPGITSYRVFRTEQRFDPSGQAPSDIRFTVMAIIEYEGDAEALTALYTGERWLKFMDEYIHVLEDDSPLYMAHEVIQTDKLSREAFREAACQCPQ